MIFYLQKFVENDLEYYYFIRYRRISSKIDGNIFLCVVRYQYSVK